MPALPPDAVVAYIDGGSRGNPGPAGFGVRVESPAGSLIEELHESIGTATNNVAEYRGLLAALCWALDHGHPRLHIRSDSELLVKQMRGEYRVKNPGLQALHGEAKDLARRFTRVSFEHVPRSANAHADRLANQAMDEAAKGGRGPATSDPGRRTPASANRQTSLPFDDLLPDNAPHSTTRPRIQKRSKT